MKLVKENCCGTSIKVNNMLQVKKCPVCDNEGISVSNITVEHMVSEDYRKAVGGHEYWICMSEYCNVVYYNTEDGVIFLKDQVNVPIWFKKDSNPKYACYCSEVTEEQVIESVVKHGAKSVIEVNAITGAMKNSNCKEKNPLGTCCHKIIQEAIQKGLAMK